MPKRIQITRKHPWRKDHPDAVIVDRPTKWGNPYTLGMMQKRLDVLADLGLGESLYETGPRALAVEAFRSDLTYGPDSQWWWFGPHMQIITIKQALQKGELAGRDVACWCPVPAVGELDICHGRVLLDLANS